MGVCLLACLFQPLSQGQGCGHRTSLLGEGEVTLPKMRLQLPWGGELGPLLRGPPTPRLRSLEPGTFWLRSESWQAVGLAWRGGSREDSLANYIH